MAKQSAPKTVTLVSPDGREVNSSSPLEISRLHYGLGHEFKAKGQTYTTALESLGDDAVFTEPIAAVAAPAEPAKDAPKK